jgi:methyltransferase (TIGR00027 family)
MSESEPSLTALSAAWLRAVHQLMDAAPAILDDPAVVALFGDDAADHVRASTARLQGLGARVLRSHVVLRSRFAEDRLQQAIARGVKQYVVLGAGYDTFCVRQPAWASGLRIIEVDQRATQRDKRARLKQAALVVPKNVDFLSVDFEADSLESALTKFGIDRTQPTFFSWLGVTMYLTEPAIAAVLSTIASFAPASEVVLSFAPAPEEGQSLTSTLADRVAQGGEPWLSCFTTESMQELLSASGLAAVEFLTPSLATAYYAGRSDALPAPARTLIVSAIR